MHQHLIRVVGLPQSPCLFTSPPSRIMPSFYIFIILISLPLNALALVTFTCKIREKKPAVIYMSHLACVDLLFTLLLPLKIHYHLNTSDWVFGEAACRVLSEAYYCYMYCSILLMMSMSVDRLQLWCLPVPSSDTGRSARKATCDVGVTCHDVLYHTQLYSYLFSILSCLYFFLPLVVTLKTDPLSVLVEEDKKHNHTIKHKQSKSSNLSEYSQACFQYLFSTEILKNACINILAKPQRRDCDSCELGGRPARVFVHLETLTFDDFKV
ncbi:hypothetical protein QQF64_018908 [Cirrhinus molitorella]|uniref:G-protein coupled receptors family 1 profile domain-containing protein n=1 Tax=Cirrhinus molitorella TaxID=172907 RepID=A0ABR3LHF3_9TELE